VSLQGIEKVLVGGSALEEGIAKARIETTNAQVTPALRRLQIFGQRDKLRLTGPKGA